MTDADANMDESSSFRLAKRRKSLRKRQDVEDAESASAPRRPPEVSARQSDVESHAINQEPHGGKEISVAEIMRLRKLNRSRKGGIEFSTTTSKLHDATPSTTTLALRNAEEQRFTAIADRFTPHSGQVVDVDKHMMAYIETEMAKRRDGDAMSNAHVYVQTPGSTPVGVDGASDKFSQKQPASLGRLHEIDLGPDAALRNAQRTEAAIKRQNGEEVEVQEETTGQKPRLGRDGKPWRRRRRRNSEDVKRDKLVEEVLRESKLEIYDEPQLEDGNDDQEADDRIAEQFRQDFMEAMQTRQRNSKSGGQPKPPLGPGSKLEPPKGPKLGGSRSARAAMREQQEKAVKK